MFLPTEEELRGVSPRHTSTQPVRSSTSRVAEVQATVDPPVQIPTLQKSYATLLDAGLEIHCSANDCPFGFTDILDVDAVFRDEIDQSTYSLYIGYALASHCTRASSL